MRVKFGTWIQECSFVSYPGRCKRSINANTGSGLYTIIFKTPMQARLAYIQILHQGYYDASNEKYSN